MKYNFLQGMKFSQITLGTAQLGFNYGIANKVGKPSENIAFEILTDAIKSGINVFDTAPAYGDSEKILGNYFSKMEKDNQSLYPIVVTKIPSMTNKGNFTDAVLYETMKDQLIDSQRNLNLEKIPLCLLHDPKDLIKDNGTVVDCLHRLKKENLVSKIGVSIYSPEDVKTFLQIKEFDAIQIPINIFDQRLIQSGLLAELKRREIITFARSIYLQGLLLLSLDSIPSHLEIARKFLQELHNLSRDFKISITEIAWSFVRDLQGITSLVIGMETPEQLKENVKLVEIPPLDDRITKRIYEFFGGMSESIINPSKWNKS